MPSMHYAGIGQMGLLPQHPRLRPPGRPRRPRDAFHAWRMRCSQLSRPNPELK
jgi:hypothetical protein